MSISPTEAQGFASSSSSEPLPANPEPNHGKPLSQSPPSPLSRSPPSSAGRVSGLLASTADGSGGSSQKVSQSAASNGKKFGSSKSRGNTSGAPAASRNQRSAGSADSDASSMQSSGRRSQSISGNHLLNFQYDPINRSHPRPPPRKTQKIRAYNRDLFLQANYKFVILQSENYSPESMDPDKMLQWEDIICVKYSTSSTVQCPICLEFPLCPQITSCGHIFCFPCVLQYLSIGEDSHQGESFKRCPLCFVMISRKDLYTLHVETVKQYSVGDSVEFMLLTRQKDSFAPTQKCKLGTAEQHNGDEGDMFSKFTFTLDVDLSVRRAIADLDSWLARAESGLVDDIEKLPYVSAAIKELEKRKKCWTEHRGSDVSKSCKYSSCQAESPAPHSVGCVSNTNACRLRGGIQTTDDKNLGKMKEPMLDKSELVSSPPGHATQYVEEKDSILLSEAESKLSERRASVPGDMMKENDAYNFYQGCDGQNIILHPLNMKCLLHHYGSYDMLPHRITGRILEMETVTQTEAVRRRYRCLSHFSLTTSFQLCEIDLSELLPSESLLPFIDEIKKREKQRKQLAKKERREQVKAQAAAEIPMSIQFNMGQSSHAGPSTYSMDDFQALGNAPVLSTSPPVVGERKTFSNVTRLGFAAGHDSPALKIDEDSHPNNGNMKVESSRTNGSRGPSTPSFANMISRARSVETTEATKRTPEMGKKGKKGTQLLLSTAGGRRY